jgi:hypothetical protein
MGGRLDDQSEQETIATFPGHGTIVVVRNADGSLEIHQNDPAEPETTIIYIPAYLLPDFIKALGQK